MNKILFFVLFLCIFGYVKSDCPNGGIHSFTNSSICYSFVTEALEFIEAEKSCQSSGGHLASISDEYTNALLAQHAKKILIGATDFWIGGLDLGQKDHWIWIDGAKFTFSNWAWEEPNELPGFDCVGFTIAEEVWYTYDCFKLKPYVCEIPSTAPLPTAETRSPPTTTTQNVMSTLLITSTTPPTTPSPTLPPTIAGSTLLPLSPTMPPSITTSAPPKGLDRNCGCTRNKIWLDIVAVMDNSLSMGQTGFAQIQANLASIVGQLTLSSGPGYSSRIALVTFASAATNVADLNAFNDTNMFMKKLFAIPVVNDDEVNILSGLQMANTILGNNVVANRRRVVILYTSAYDDTGSESPVSLALNMREDNIKIITIAFSQKMGSDEVNKVGELAWPSFDFVNEEPGLPDKMYNALCQTNCFCPPNWQQYTTNITNKYAPGYGVCLYLSSITSAWIPASFACGNEVPGAYLTTESTSEKHNFNFAYAKKSDNINGVYSYHIGLQYQNGQYSWQQFNGSNPVPLDNSYTYWNAGYPNQNIGECVKVDKVLGKSYKWTNVNCYSSFLNYICEVYTCDTDNYCPPNKR